MFPVRFNPSAVFVVVSFNPDLSAWRLSVNIDGREGGQKRQADTKSQQFHFQLLLPS